MAEEFWVKCCSDSKQKAEGNTEGKEPSSGFVFSLFIIQSIKLKVDWLTAYLHDCYSVQKPWFHFKYNKMGQIVLVTKNINWTKFVKKLMLSMFRSTLAYVWPLTHMD